MAETNEREKLERALFLAEAGEHIADADVRIAGVQAHTAELELGGRNASEALKVLEALEGALELMRRQRDEIARLLDMGDGHRLPPPGSSTSALQLIGPA